MVNYLENPPTVAELERLTKQLSLAAEAIVRKKEPRFQELGLNKNPPKSVAAWLKILSDNPILIERPIVTNGIRAVLGRPPENVLELLK